MLCFFMVFGGLEKLELELYSDGIMEAKTLAAHLGEGRQNPIVAGRDIIVEDSSLCDG